MLNINLGWGRQALTIVADKEDLPTFKTTLDGKLDGYFATIFPITERMSGDTDFNEKRRLLGIEIHKHDGHTTYIERIKDKNIARKLFDGWY